MHGNNKSDDELRAAAEAGAGLVVLDALDEIERARRRPASAACSCASPPGSRPTRTRRSGPAHHGSKFGLPPDEALEAIAQAREAGLDVAGLHVHVGSQLLDTDAPRA